MKKTIHFSKGFIPAVILSIAVIAAGIFCIVTKGINFGLDFKAGLIEEFKLAPTAIQLTYNGAANVSVQTNAQGVNLIVSGLGSENTTHNFSYYVYPTIAEMAKAMNEVEGVSAEVKADDPAASAQGLFTNSEVSAILSDQPFNLHIAQGAATDVTSDDIRNTLVDIDGVAVKAMGQPLDNHFQIRIGDDGSDPEMSKNMLSKVSSELSAKYGTENYAVIKTDFIGSQYSGKLIWQSIMLVLATLLLIWIYATIRFHWDYALAAVVGILHDSLIMIAFIVFTQMEFTSTSIAAILTIIGYSINNTVVVMDRIRENVKLLKAKKMNTIWDISQTQLLNRSLLTTITTMLAVLSLFIFTTGSIHDFALLLIIGLISGFYSSILIAGSVLAVTRKNWTPSEDEKKTQVIEIEE